MDLFYLIEDVIRYIFAHLDGRDALWLSLTCKRVHDLAIPRVAAVIVCSNAHSLRRLHAYMLSRALCAFASSPSGAHAAAPLPPLRAQFMERLLKGIFHTNIKQQFDLLVDLLAHAPNLRHLSLPSLHPMLDCEPRLAEPLRALPRLISFKGEPVGDTVLALFHSFPAARKARPRLLQLSYHGPRMYGAYHVEGERTTCSGARSWTSCAPTRSRLCTRSGCGFSIPMCRWHGPPPPSR
ncbi:hypothetical protein BV20DRAFT_949929 [Pilatotrama ljubarskyi]|nr:hypothetical protein BV20DRAFT_949929 [Pilatotrama ljubarskyi]